MVGFLHGEGCIPFPAKASIGPRLLLELGNHSLLLLTRDEVKSVAGSFFIVKLVCISMSFAKPSLIEMRLILEHLEDCSVESDSIDDLCYV
jgi:hypothetical protein